MQKVLSILFLKKHVKNSKNKNLRFEKKNYRKNKILYGLMSFKFLLIKIKQIILNI